MPHQSRIPREHRVLDNPDYLWQENADGGASPNPPVETASTGQAFAISERGGLQVNLGADITDDLIWEENGNGGVQLKLP